VALRRSGRASVYATGRCGKAVDRRTETALSWLRRAPLGQLDPSLAHPVRSRVLCPLTGKAVDKSPGKVISKFHEERFWVRVRARSLSH
jgi:hypothetical protein